MWLRQAVFPVPGGPEMYSVEDMFLFRQSRITEEIFSTLSPRQGSVEGEDVCRALMASDKSVNIMQR